MAFLFAGSAAVDALRMDAEVGSDCRRKLAIADAHHCGVNCARCRAAAVAVANVASAHHCFHLELEAVSVVHAMGLA